MNSPPQYQLWLHEDILNATDQNSTLQKRLAIVLQQLAAQGRTSVVKLCLPPNDSWRRSPMGGNGGNQFYLWWQNVTTRRLPDGESTDMIFPAIIIRALRTHDDHSELSTGPVPQDYIALAPRDTANPEAGIIQQPWTPQQQSFNSSHATVKTINGYPGSGKTSSLLESIVQDHAADILFITWSDELAQSARARILALTANQANVTATTMRGLIQQVNSGPVPDPTMPERISLVEQALQQAKLTHHQDSPWTMQPSLLYRECRINIFGNPLLPWHPDSPLQLPPAFADSFAQTRPNLKLAQSFIAIMHTLTSSREASQTLVQAFPELAHARTAIQSIQATLPASLAQIDAIAVDEVQDLTPLELTLIAQLAAAIRDQSGSAPIVITAGDEAQTVQPSGFEWKTLSTIFSQHLFKPEQHTADHNLRTSPPVVAALAKLDALYNDLDRNSRPSFRWTPQPASNIPGTVNVVAAPPPELNQLLAQLAQRPDLILVNAADSRPDWLDERAPTPSHPASVKGTEHRHVCIIGAASAIRQHQQALQAPRWPQIANQQARASFDLLRIAASRAIETLTFIETPQTASTMTQLLGKRTHCTPNVITWLLEQDQHNPTEAITHITSLNTGPVPDFNHAWNLLKLANDCADEVPEQHPQHQHIRELAANITYQTTMNLWLLATQPTDIPDDSLTLALQSASHSPHPNHFRNILNTTHQWATRRDNPGSLIDLAANTHPQYQSYITRFITEHAELIIELLDAAAANIYTAVETAKRAHHAADFISTPGDAEQQSQHANHFLNNALVTVLEANRFDLATEIYAIHPNPMAELATSYHIMAKDWPQACHHATLITDAEVRAQAFSNIQYRIAEHASSIIKQGRFQETRGTTHCTATP